MVRAQLEEAGINTLEQVIHKVLNVNEILEQDGLIQFQHQTLRALVNMSLKMVLKEKNETSDMVLATTKTMRKIPENIWLGDSGASTHMGFSDAGMFDVEEKKSTVQMGNGQTLRVEKIGKKRVTIYQKDGNLIDCVLDDYKFVPDLWVNLFSITKALRNKWNIGNEEEVIVLEKNGKKIKFDHEIVTTRGHIQGIEILPREKTLDVAMACWDAGEAVEAERLHKVLGHCGMDHAKKTAEKCGWKVTGKWPVCEHCAIAKARQTPVPKQTESHSTVRGERLMVDISSVRCESGGGKKFWILIMDEWSDYCWSFFVPKKSDLPIKVMSVIKSLKMKNGIQVEKIRLDNAGENKALQAKSEEELWDIKFEFTSPDTPQQNGKVERRFATMYGKMRAMFRAAGLSQELKENLWCEAASHATDLENVLVKKKDGLNAKERLFGEEEKTTIAPHCFGEMGVVTDMSSKKARSKLADRGKIAMFLGRSMNHESKAFRFLNMKTRRVIISRNVRWLNKTYAEWEQDQLMKVTPVQANPWDESFQVPMERLCERSQALEGQIDEERKDAPEMRAVISELNDLTGENVEEDTVIIEEECDDSGGDEKAVEENEDSDAKQTPRLTREVKSLGTSSRMESVQSNKHALKSKLKGRYTLRQQRSPKGETNPEAGFMMIEGEMGALGVEELDPEDFRSNLTAPKTYREAWDHPELEERAKWREAITKEYQKMEAHQVWKKIDKAEMEEGRRCVKHKWVFDIKRNGVFRARLVACGYSQIAGVDFNEIYSPVVNDTTVRMVLVMAMEMGLEFTWNVKKDWSTKRENVCF